MRPHRPRPGAAATAPLARTDGDEAVLRVRYEFVGHLDPVTRRLLGRIVPGLLRRLDIEAAAIVEHLADLLGACYRVR